MPIVMLRKKSDTYDKQIQERNRALESFEEIANTYLKTSSPASTTPKRLPPPKRRPFALVPWIVAVVALVAAAGALISRSNFDIKIRVLGNAPYVSKAASGESTLGLTGREVFLVRGGEAVRTLIERTNFIGDANNGSKAFSNEIVLTNGTGGGNASLRFDLAKPLDLSRNDIGYFAKSDTEGAHLVLVLTDGDGRSYRVQDESLTRLTKDWHVYHVNFKPVKETVDMAAITGIRFEFGSATTGNSPRITISVKDIYMAPSKRLKWL